MCTHSPKGGSKGLDVYPRPQGRIQRPPSSHTWALVCTQDELGQLQKVRAECHSVKLEVSC